jgi:hypothetical protein
LSKLKPSAWNIIVLREPWLTTTRSLFVAIFLEGKFDAGECDSKLCSEPNYLSGVFIAPVFTSKWIEVIELCLIINLLFLFYRNLFIKTLFLTLLFLKYKLILFALVTWCVYIRNWTHSMIFFINFLLLQSNKIILLLLFLFLLFNFESK